MTAIRGARVLVTGGTGSFGTRVAARLAAAEAARVVIFSRDETKQSAMRRQFGEFEYMLGDVRDAARLVEAMRGVDVVFHAAALKQVPSCEAHPYETVLTNTVGSQHVCTAALAAGVKMVVALSTDKAVKPVNAMGLSKALMEKIVCARNQAPIDTIFCCVRYGNVMGSRGSVIPLFRRQIEAGGPVTVTLARMTRFLLTLDQAVDLVVHAMTHATGGEIFVRKAPAATVGDLACAMIRSYGAGVEIPVTTVGVRPGEKIDEVLVNEYEVQRARETDDYFVIYPEYRELTHTPRHPVGYEYTSANTHRVSDPHELSALLDRMGSIEDFI
jgi:UDP-N-acetylglucosamine 4,6-dehydratase